MVLPSVRAWARNGFVRDAHWFALQPGAPTVEAFDRLPLTLHHLALAPAGLAAYARTKERLWADIHGLPAKPWNVEDFRFYARYNWFTADAILERVGDLDLAYLHDFQLMQVGNLIGLAGPAVLRWHVPFVPNLMPKATRHFLVDAMQTFDSVIVNTRRELEGLVNAGFHGHARQVYPHIDSSEWPTPTSADRAELEQAWALKPDETLFLVVARMDPMKRHDLAIQALAKLRRRHPTARLAIVGNGSFSGSRGGLRLGKAQQWLGALERKAKELHVQDAVIFGHWIPDRLLAAAYERCTAVLVPSDIEGFNLTVLESWAFSRPALVSKGAGSAEIVHDGVTGYRFQPGDDERLAGLMARLLKNRELTERLGQAGHATLRTFDAPAGAAREREVLHEAYDRFGEPRVSRRGHAASTRPPRLRSPPAVAISP